MKKAHGNTKYHTEAQRIKAKGKQLIKSNEKAKERYRPLGIKSETYQRFQELKDKFNETEARSFDFPLAFIQNKQSSVYGTNTQRVRAQHKGRLIRSRETFISKGKNNAVLLRRRDEKSQNTKAPSGRG